MYKNVIVVIPARYNSKRFKNKNTSILYNNLNLIENTIEYILNENIISKKNIYLNSDSEKYIKIAHSYNINSYLRSEENATDVSSTASAIKEQIENMDANNLKKIKAVIVLQVTNPIREKGLIKNGLEKFMNLNSNSLISVTKIQHKIFNYDNKIQPINFQIGGRSQELKNLYAENGQLYITKPSMILNNCIYDRNSQLIISSDQKSLLDIDYEEDLNLINKIMSK